MPYANILQAEKQDIAALQPQGIKYGLPVLGLSEANGKVRLLRATLQFCERLTRVFGDPDRILMNRRQASAFLERGGP